uniref:ribonuclease H n=1 Tax=Mastacembelus armatus TaxID=205130 RepID=A0A3Q3LH95_9TELE
MVSCLINGKELMFLVDTGATCSSVTKRFPLTDTTLTVVGYQGTPQTQKYTIPLAVQYANQTITHSFLHAPDCLLNLLGRDLLIKLRLHILSESQDMWKISYCSTETVCYQHVWLPRHHWHERTDHPEAASFLSHIPPHIWTNGSHNIGLLDMPPILIQVKAGCSPLWQPQYRLPTEKEEGFHSTMTGLLDAGVLIPIYHSDWNTPILPVQKSPGNWRMVEDFRPVNDVTVPNLQPVPDPYLEVQNLTLLHTCFTVIDLANAFLCIPLHPDSPYIFSFTYRGQRYTYTRLPQGFRDSPGLFNAALKTQLVDLTLPPDVVLLLYVDDLLLAAPTAPACLDGTHSLLCHLSTKDYKVKKEDVQLCQRLVTFLGREISGKGSLQVHTRKVPHA